MDAKIKETLEKQLNLLSERSGGKNVTIQELCELSSAIADLGYLLHQYENQSCGGVPMNFPCVVQLPAKDLVELYAAKAELLNRSDKSHRK